MKLGKTLALAIAVVALVVIGAGAVLASAGGGSPAANGGTGVPDAATPTATPGAAATPTVKAPFLTQVLDGLVTKGTITKAQEQAILDAWIGARTTRIQDAQAQRKLLKTILSDGVITQDELKQLPADSPLQKLAPLMKDGKINVSDLRSLGRGILHDLRLGGMGGRLGGMGHGPLALPSASPTTSG